MKPLVSLALAACMVACSGSTTPGRPDATDPRVDADNDRDYDGVTDDVDNCPQSANGSQANEDGDKFGDPCDPCPHLADDNPPDTDADGVADACDPNPTFFGDAINKFEGFAAGVPEGWDKTGVWTLAPSAARVASTTMIATLAINTTNRTRETLVASITVESVGATAFAGVIDNKQVGGPSGVRCALAVFNAQQTIALTDTNDVANASTSPYQMTAGQTYIVRLRRANDEYTCDAASGSATATTMKTVALANTPYLSGLTVLGATVRVNWFIVIDSL